MDPVVKNESVEYKNSTRKFTWKIDNFKKFYDQIGNRGGIISQKHSVFSDANPKKLLFKWFFRLYPKGQNKSCENALSVFFNIESLKIPYVIADGIWSIKDEKGIKITCRKFNYKLSKAEGYGYSEFLPKDYISKYAITNKLTFEADLTFSFYHKSLPVTEDIDFDSDDSESDHDDLVINLLNSQMSQDISDFLNKDILSDVTISAGDQKYFAHKVILSARCSVFAAMFAHDFKENNENVVTVEESPTVFYQILEYIYSNKLPTEDTISEELYAAAHKYGLDEFQNECQVLLENSITVENVLKRLKCADLHNIDGLKKKAMNFMKANFKDIIKTQEWSDLLQDNVKLVNEVLHFVHT